MGCTQSTPQTPSPPPTALAPAPTTLAARTPAGRHRHATTTTSSSLSASSSLSSRHISQARSRRAATAPLAHPSPWRSKSRTWTPAALARERAAFFDTRVSGSAEAWGAVQLATSMARADLVGEPAATAASSGAIAGGVIAGGAIAGGAIAGGVGAAGDDDTADADVDADNGRHGAEQPSERDGLRGAKAVLEAAGLSVPTGFLVDGVWDERGVLYKLPRWVVSDPLNIEADDESTAETGEEKKITGGILAWSEGDDAAEMANGDKGKSIAAVCGGKGGGDGDTVVADGEAKTPLKLRMSDYGADVILAVSPEETTVREIVGGVRRQANIPPGTRVELAYMGKMLKDGKALAPQDWRAGDVVNCLVFR